MFKINKKYNLYSIILLLAFSFVFVNNVQARDIYIAPNGDDSGDGSINHPYKTIKKVFRTNEGNGVIQSGDHVYLRQGLYVVDARMSATYDNKFGGFSLKSLHDIIIESYPGEWAHIHVPLSGWWQQTAMSIGVDCRNITLRNFELSGGPMYALSHAGRNVTVGKHRQSIASKGITIENMKIHDGGEDILKFQPTVAYVKIKNNVIEQSCASSRVDPTLEVEMTEQNNNCQAYDSVRANHHKIEDNTFAGISYRNSFIIPKGGGRDVLIKNNYITSERSTAATGAVFIGGNTGGEFRDENDNPSGYELLNGVVVNNIIENTLFNGFGITSANGLKVLNNTMLHLGEINLQNPLWSHNLISKHPTSEKDGRPLGIRPMNNWSCNSWPDNCTNQHFNNVPSRNIFSFGNIITQDYGNADSNSLHEGMIYVQNPDENGVKSADDHTMKFDDNVYWNPHTGDLWGRDGNDSAHNHFNTLSLWQSSSIFINPFNEIHSLFSDPNLNKFLPQSNSPAISVNVPLDNDGYNSKDIYGNDRPSGQVDAGAVQRRGIAQDCNHYPDLCNTQTSCESAGWNWWEDDKCRKHKSAHLRTCEDEPYFCTTQTDCENASWYWVDIIKPGRTEHAIGCQRRPNSETTWHWLTVIRRGVGAENAIVTSNPKNLNKYFMEGKFPENGTVQLTSSASGVVWSGDCNSNGQTNIGTDDKICYADYSVNCDATHLPACTTENDCNGAGGNWCNEQCQASSCSTIRADVDQSGTVNSTDAMLTLRNSLGLDMSGTNWHTSATTGDVNCNNTSNSTDAMLLLRYSLGLSMNGTDWCE